MIINNSLQGIASIYSNHSSNNKIAKAHARVPHRSSLGKRAAADCFRTFVLIIFALSI